MMGNSGLYIAASGGMAQYERLEHLTNNLANANTTGYKADRPVFTVERPDYASQLRPWPAPGSAADVKSTAFAMLDGVEIDLATGGFEETGNPLDVAIGGEGFLAVKGAEETLYTRAGALHVSPEGTLTTIDGFPVLGEGGAEITIAGGVPQIATDGTVAINGQPVDRLLVAVFEEGTRFERFGHSLFRATRPDGGPTEAQMAEAPQVMQGTLETSNVNPVKAMVELISTNRAFEQFTKSVKALDEMEEKAVAQMARPR